MKHLFFLFLIIFFGQATNADAASLFFVPENNSVGVGKEFFVDIKVDTEESFINAVQTQVNYPNSILEVVDIERNNSIFSFWLKEPEFSNEEGKLEFIGGSATGSRGESLEVLRIKFKSIGAGSANLNMVDSVVTANDGKGTNVLRTIKNTSINVSTQAVRVTPPATTKVVVDEVMETPQRVERVAIQTVGLPNKPNLKVPLYPNQEKWYSHQGEVIVLWDIPEDITKIAVSVNQKPISEPMNVEDELFTGKKIGVLGDGEHFIHVQFKNNNGWGKTSHYRIAIDTVPPIPLDLNISSQISDNPNPILEYVGLDALSGFDYARIIIDDKDFVISTTSPFKLPLQSPGSHTVVIEALDRAGNSVMDDLSFEILPLETPVIDYVTKNISEGEEVFVSGYSIPNNFVDLTISREKIVVHKISTETDNSGHWNFVVDKSLTKGNYEISVNARDERGAISYPSETNIIRVGAKTILSIGFIDLSLLELIWGVVLLISTIVGFGSWYYITERDRKYAYKIIALRDLQNISNLLEKGLGEIEALVKNQKRLPVSFKTTLNTLIEKMKKYIGNNKKYVGKNIERS